MVSSTIEKKRHLQENLKVEVKPCGLFINQHMPYLGASPDGIIDDDGIVEIKCPSSCSDKTPEQAIKEKIVTFFNHNDKTGEVEVNKNHNYFYQIQGQLKIANKSSCLFVFWTPLGVYTKIILRDDEFWKTKMEEKLKMFYFDCLLPELVDPRYTRLMAIRDPIYILEAQAKREQKKKPCNSVKNT